MHAPANTKKVINEYLVIDVIAGINFKSINSPGISSANLRDPFPHISFLIVIPMISQTVTSRNQRPFLDGLYSKEEIKKKCWSLTFV